jgi:hypothetical protein
VYILSAYRTPRSLSWPVGGVFVGGAPIAQANDKPTRDAEDIVAEAAKETNPEKLYKLSCEMQRVLDKRDESQPTLPE